MLRPSAVTVPEAGSEGRAPGPPGPGRSKVMSLWAYHRLVRGGRVDEKELGVRVTSDLKSMRSTGWRVVGWPDMAIAAGRLTLRGGGEEDEFARELLSSI
eukprot:762997-Hanusia_phi.AAC.1